MRSHSVHPHANAPRPRRLTRHAGVALLLVLSLSACVRRTRPGVGPRPGSSAQGGAFDVTRLYRQAGLIAESRPLPFVGSVSYLAGPSPDSTLVLVALSLANRALSFEREGEQYKAAYEVTTALRRDTATVSTATSGEIVRVSSFKETTRNDESVIFQQYVTAAPGQYTLELRVRDPESGHSVRHESEITVPRLSETGLSTPVPVHEGEPRTSRDSLPRLVTSPRATVAFGRDSLVRVYVEAYGAADTIPVSATVRDGNGTVVWANTLALSGEGSVHGEVISVPVSDLGIGLATLAVHREGARDTSRTPVFVGLGDNLAVGSFEEMLNYLRYFTSPERLDSLRSTPPARRSAAWAEFLRESDPFPGTLEHEALRDYFGRIEQANLRYREEGASGWLSDRGMVYVALGEPDQILEEGQSEMGGQRGRRQVWQYHQYNVSLLFVDQTGFGRWKLAPSSEADFQSILRRVRAR